MNYNMQQIKNELLSKKLKLNTINMTETIGVRNLILMKASIEGI